MNNIKTYYMIKIFTNTNESKPEIGLDSGVITFVTERIPEDTISENTKDGTIYNTKVYSNFLKRDGINKTSQKIDIINGGDYSNLNNFGFTIINKATNGDTYAKVTDELTESYLIGSDVKFYICEHNDTGNDLVTSKWTGIISNTSYNDSIYNFACIDKFMREYEMLPRTTIYNDDNKNNIPIIFGDNKYSKPILVENNRVIDEFFKSQTVLRIKPNITEDRNRRWELAIGSANKPTKTNNITTLQQRYLHNQKSSDINNELSEYEHGIEIYEQYIVRGEVGLVEFPNQYHNGTSWAVVSNKIHFNDPFQNRPESEFIGKYIQFSENKIPTDDELKSNTLYRIIGTDKWGVELLTPSGWVGAFYAAFYIEDIPEVLIDNSQFYGDGLNTDDTNGGTSHGGEIVNEDTLYFNIIDVQNKLIISESSIAGIEYIKGNPMFIYPKDDIRVYVKGENNDIIASLPTAEVVTSGINPYIKFAGNKYIDNKIISYSYLKPNDGYWENIQLDYAENKGYRLGLNNALNSDSSTFDWVVPGLYKDWIASNPVYPDLNEDYYEYHKCNIYLSFDKLFNIEDYDGYYILPNMQRQYTYSPEALNINTTKTYFPPVSDLDTGVINQGNYSAYHMDLEIRGKVNTSEGERFTHNFNNSTNNLYMPLGNIEHDQDCLVSGTHEYFRFDFKRMISIPFNIIPYEDTISGISGYMNVFPKEMRFNTYHDDYDVNDRFWVEGLSYDTLNELEFDKELFTINEDDNNYNLILSITPHTSNPNVPDPATMTPTWDVLRLYNIGMLLKKDIDINKDIYLKVKGETLPVTEPDDIIYYVRHTDNGLYDGEYIRNYDVPTSIRYYCATADNGNGAILYLTGTSEIDAKWTITDVIPGTTTPNNNLYTIDANYELDNPCIGIYTRVAGSTVYNDVAVSRNTIETSINVSVTDVSEEYYAGIYYKVNDEYYQHIEHNTGILLEQTLREYWNIGDVNNSVTHILVDQQFIFNVSPENATPIPVGTWEGINSSGDAIVTGGLSEYETNNIYNTLKHIVNNYSNISNVNYHNLSTTRKTWNVGRQITSKKNSFDYIRELCQQSFIVGWVDGNGTVNFNAFREGLAEDDTLVIHNNDIIIDGSIKGFKRTSISKVYNEINVEYDWNPITQAFNYNYAINYIDEPSFPDITDNWTDFVQGINDYAEAKDMWYKAHNSYLETRVVNSTPTDRTKLLWANDLGSFYDNDTYDKTEEYAFKYFKLSLDWLTRQKYQVNYKLPITDDTKLLELMQRVKFSDDIIGTYVGWITDISFDSKHDTIDIQLTMELNKSRWSNVSCPDIIEKGTNIDWYTETGNESDDNINEGCN